MCHSYTSWIYNFLHNKILHMCFEAERNWEMSGKLEVWNMWEICNWEYQEENMKLKNVTYGNVE